MTTDYAALRVLVIDDQPIVRRWTIDVLETFGITQVTAVQDGRAAIHAVIAPGASFDLILCDLQMPDTDGVETIRTFARLGVRAAVAILSMENERIIESAGLLAMLGGLHVVGAIPKPLTAAKLDPVLRRVRAHTYLDPPNVADITDAEVVDAFGSDALGFAFQPIVTLASDSCVAAEALVHWDHPRHGRLDDDIVRPLLERAPILPAFLTARFTEVAFGAAGRWLAEGHTIGVLVRIPAHAFTSLQLPETLDALARRHKVHPQHVTIAVADAHLDVTDVSLMDVATRLRLKGFRFALDAFRGSWDGIDEMLRLPFDTIRLSPTAVDGCASSAPKRAVVEAGLAVARSLTLTTIAVGVTHAIDHDYLAALGCDQAQGRYIAPPMSEHGIGDWVEGRAARAP
jgi:EAL domain-containing protein (putative c-di-GMP-specific phosphodiesterase class I)